jgi:tetratricopeptide (TPR) repeat protein
MIDSRDDGVRPSSALELDDAIYEQIKCLCAAGDEFSDQQRHDEALVEYNKAWQLVPEPKSEWEASTWILTAIGDSCFLLGKNKSAREALEYAMHCPGAIGNPFIHLRLGQVLFDAGEKDSAANELIRAYMGEGAEIFEPEDPKYLAFLGTRAIL